MQMEIRTICFTRFNWRDIRSVTEHKCKNSLFVSFIIHQLPRLFVFHQHLLQAPFVATRFLVLIRLERIVRCKRSSSSIISLLADSFLNSCTSISSCIHDNVVLNSSLSLSGPCVALVAKSCTSCTTILVKKRWKRALMTTGQVSR